MPYLIATPKKRSIFTKLHAIQIKIKQLITV